MTAPLCRRCPLESASVGTFDDLLSRLDADDRVRGKQFEHVCKWYLQTDPVYVDLFDKVWLWKEWPDRWKETEAGIDLVAKHKDGTLWALGRIWR